MSLCLCRADNEPWARRKLTIELILPVLWPKFTLHLVANRFTQSNAAKSSQGRANTCCNYKNPKLNDSARDRQRQRQKDEERERESGKLTSLQNGIMRRKRSHWKGKCPWPERADGKAKLELKLKLKETACSSHDSYGSEMEAELERDLETSKASDTVISRPTTPWNH